MTNSMFSGRVVHMCGHFPTPVPTFRFTFYHTHKYIYIYMKKICDIDRQKYFFKYKTRMLQVSNFIRKWRTKNNRIKQILRIYWFGLQLICLKAPSSVFSTINTVCRLTHRRLAPEQKVWSQFEVQYMIHTSSVWPQVIFPTLRIYRYSKEDWCLQVSMASS